MEKPFVFALSRLEWQLFVSLTFVRERMPASLCRKYWFAWARQCARVQKVHFLRLLWFLRAEFGEVGGRYHYHALLGGLTQHGLNVHTLMRLKRSWEHQPPLVLRKDVDGKYRMLSKFCGSCRIRLYSSALDALDYSDLQEVGSQSLGYSLSGANSYEAKKFGKAESVELSESVMRVIRHRHSGHSAMGVEHGQRVVTPSYHSWGDSVQLSPVRSVPDLAITGHTGVYHTEGLGHPRRGVKTAWRDDGAGIWSPVEA